MSSLYLGFDLFSCSFSLLGSCSSLTLVRNFPFIWNCKCMPQGRATLIRIYKWKTCDFIFHMCIAGFLFIFSAIASFGLCAFIFRHSRCVYGNHLLYPSSHGMHSNNSICTVLEMYGKRWIWNSWIIFNPHTLSWSALQFVSKYARSPSDI